MSTLSVTNLKNAASATNNLVLNPDGSVNISGGTLSPQTGFKNRIINGAMTIDQRNAGASVTAANNYTLDRWFAGASQTSKYTVQQNAGGVTRPIGFTNYLGVTSSSAYSVLTGDNFFLLQSIEGFNVSDLGWGTANAQTVTLSFVVYSSLTGTFGGALVNSAGNRSYPFSYSIPSANTWTTIAVTVPGDTTGTWLTTNGKGIDVRFGLGSGSTFTATANVWGATNAIQPTGSVSVVGTSGATFFLTGIQLERGSVATPFEFRSIGQELALCQRYLPKWEAKGTNESIGTGLCFSGTAAVVYLSSPVPTRVAPTGMIGSGTFQVLNSGAGGLPAAGGVVYNNGSINGLAVVATVSSGLVAGNSTHLIGTSAYILGTGCEL
jgi:hypothetical protein